MPSRKSVWPGNAQKDRRREVKPQAVFGDVYEDCPPTSVPETALAKAINGWPQGTSWRPRNGTRLFGIQYPPLTGRTGYSAHKVGNLIISDSGDIFTQADVSNLWVWDNNLTDEMTVYIDAQTMQCRDSDDNTGTDCHIQGKVNLNQWHDQAEGWVVLLGTELWTANRAKTVYEQVLIFSSDQPANAISEMIEDGDDAIIQNSRRMFHVLLSRTPIRAYAKNTPVPNVRIQSETANGELRHKYHYVYSCALLSQGDGNFYHRETQVNGVFTTKIHTESGTNQIDENRRDWAVINTSSAIGNGTDTYGRWIGGTLIAPFNAPGGWTGISDITFLANINGLGAQECIVDGSLVANMPDLALRIQDALRVYFPSATCEFVSDAAIGPHFVITSGLVAGGSVAIAEGITGTPSAANLGLTLASGAESTFPYLGVPKVLRYLYMPRQWNVAGVQYQRHWSHFVVYRSPDIGPGGVSDEDRKNSVYYSHLNVKGKRIVNSPDELVWNKDLRVAGSFIARRYHGYIQIRDDAMGGELELADEGCVMEFEDGSRTQITTYINPKLARYTAEAEGSYYGGVSEWMAAEIGNGRVVRVEQTGTTLTRFPGSATDSYTAFTGADIGKMVWFPNGVRDWIRSVNNADSVELYTSQDRDETAMTLDPVYRAYCDSVYDDDLFERSSNWLCKNRFMREILPCNMISSQPGFYIMAPRGGKEIRYCPTNPDYKYFVGYHNREYQKIELEDLVEKLVGFANRFSVLCGRSIYAGATNNSIEYTIPETFQKIFILPGMEKISEVGLINYGAAEFIDDDWLRMITNTQEIRDFNGLEFRRDSTGESVDYSVDKRLNLGRMKFALKRASRVFNTISGRNGLGWIVWWRDIPEA